MSTPGNFTLLLVLFFFGGCAHVPPAVVQSISIMSFNVENLFDNIDDPGKNDRDYLPLEQKQNREHTAACMQVEVDSWRERCLTIDWTDEIIERKLEAVATAILQVSDGTGPDIVALQEVENLHILERLRKEYLPDAGYLPAVLVEGHDVRGIDIAFLTRFPLLDQPVLHDIAFADEFADRRGDTRGILQADFRLPNGSVLTGFAVHFPAPFHPTPMRVSAYEKLDDLLAALPLDRAVFAAGDFNTTSTEDRNQDMLSRFARPNWIVSNDLCHDCRGTSYYPVDRTWSFLDMILLRPCCSKNTTIDLRKFSVEIANRSPHQVNPDGTPARFEIGSGAGVSDHWPIVMSIDLNRNSAL